MKTGGEQGNPITSLQYACCISPALKNVEQQFPGVLVRAIHDDTTLLGDTETIFSEGGARQQLATDLANVGSELHEGKAEAYGMTPEDRAQIPEDIKQPSATWTDPVTGVQQVAFGIVDCGITFGDSTFILASLDESAATICDDIHRLAGGISAISSHAAFSMANHSCMRRADFLAGSFATGLTKYFFAKIDEKIMWAFASALGTDLLAALADKVPDAAFTADRAQLPAPLGGAGIYLLSNRHLYLNMLTTVLPKLIDRVGKEGNVTPGLFNDQAARILGQGSFDHDNKENRRRTFLASDSALAVEFRDEFERAKAINSELRSRIQLGVTSSTCPRGR
jgi:hypothetical protein